MKKRISMKDIAQELGVSIALVSYVLNDKKTDRINPETAKNIKDLAARLNYTPNHIAQSLKKNKTYTLGLIIADISNLFYSNIARVIEDEADRNNYQVIFGSADENPEKFKTLIDVFTGRQVDGIILAAPAGSEDMIVSLKDSGIPFVLIDRIFPELEGINTVIIDNSKASYMAVEHFAAKGFKNPFMITLESELHHLQERSRGFNVGLQSFLNLEKDHVITIEESKLSEQVVSVLSDVLSSKVPYDSVVFATNKIAMEGLAFLAKNQIKVPEKLGVICFDEADAYRIFNTSITYLKQPLLDIGKQAVEVVLAHIDDIKGAANIILDVELVEGDSTSRQKLTKSQ